jgi:AcrR family transcriptional regulator
LETATATIAKGGVATLSMRQLSDQVGVSRTAPYRHFADKEALLAAVSEEGFKQLYAGFATALALESDTLTRFRRLGEVYIQFAIHHPTHYRLMFGQDVSGWQNYPSLAQAAEANFQGLVQLIKDCQAEQLMKVGQPEDLAYIVWAMVHGIASLIIDNQFQPHGVNVEQMIKQMQEILFTGLAYKSE